GSGSSPGDDMDALRGHSRLLSDPTLLMRLKQTAGGLRSLVFVKVSDGPTPEPVYLSGRASGPSVLVESPTAVSGANREKVLHAVLDAHRPLSRSEVARASGLGKSATSEHLRALLVERRIDSSGSNRDTRYFAPAVRPTAPSGSE